MPPGSGLRDDLDAFLDARYCKRGTGVVPTHTRIKSESHNVRGGSFHICEADEQMIIDKHFERVFGRGVNTHITEAQFPEAGPLLVDVDLHYAPSVQRRMHTSENIEAIVALYVKYLTKYLEITVHTILHIYVLEKKRVNCLPGKTKDGIHIIIGVDVPRSIQMEIRKDIVRELESGALWDALPVTNTWDSVIDVAVARGGLWQMYGSRKPGHDAYEVTRHYSTVMGVEGWLPPVLQHGADSFSVEKNKYKLSARYRGWTEPAVREGFSNLLEDRKKPTARISGGDIVLSQIENEEQLDQAIAFHFTNPDAPVSEYRTAETHQFALALPEAYYGPNSYDKWIRVGWALANTHPKMFVTWLKMSCRDNCRTTLTGVDGKFDWSNVGVLWDTWCNFDFTTAETEGLSYRSIMFWCKTDARSEFDDIKKTTIDYFIDESLDPGRQVKNQFAAWSKAGVLSDEKKSMPKTTHTEFDVAQVLYQLFKDQYVCASIKNGIWYEFVSNRWREIDSGSTLRLAISKHLYAEYLARVIALMNRQNTLYEEGVDDDDSPELRYLKWKVVRLTEVLPTLKKTIWKNNIMREAKELFYDKEFYTNLDQNPYLLCFKNGVIDFKAKAFRRGLPEDYISFCTNIEYYPKESSKRDASCEKELMTFMSQLFPNPSLKTYMWEHLASSLIGTQENQTFNMYVGSGRNGKSVLVDLMARVLGNYKGTVPTTLITQTRPSIGSTSSEIAQLRGLRYAVMQEPSKGDKVNEGILKEVTGGDPIQGRALFKDTVTFIPQFTLVVCTNTLFDIKSNDDGTWRRIRKCDFVSKFLESPYQDELRFPKERHPHQFKLDKRLDKKFDRWAPILAYMLAERAFETQGNVKDCDIVMSASMEYREGQDAIAKFVRECVVMVENQRLMKAQVNNTFRDWWEEENGSKDGRPKNKEVHEYLNIMAGQNAKNRGWVGYAIVNQADDGSDEDVDAVPFM